MTQEDKQLLLKDLCARLPYGVRVLQGGHEHMLMSIDVYTLSFDSSCAIPRPYLRPMSSMTEEERKEYWQIKCPQYDENNNIINTDANIIDWLNAHHFDYRGLIDKGLALEVTDENNPYKN